MDFTDGARGIEIFHLNRHDFVFLFEQHQHSCGLVFVSNIHSFFIYGLVLNNS